MPSEGHETVDWMINIDRDSFLIPDRDHDWHYDPHPGVDVVLGRCDEYVEHIHRGWAKLVVGIICMTRDKTEPVNKISQGQAYTPVQDLERLVRYDKDRPKAGAMLWTWTYDVTDRNDHKEGTGEANGAVTKRIYDNLQLSL